MTRSYNKPYFNPDRSIPVPRCPICGILKRNRSWIVLNPDTLVCERCEREARRGAKMTGDEFWELTK